MHSHDYIRVSENADGVVEVCKECKYRLITRKDIKGRIDNKEYLKEHVRDTAQPTGITSKVFKQYYAKNN